MIQGFAYWELNSLPPISTERTARLIQRWQRLGDESSREEVIRTNARFVIDIAKTVHYRGRSQEEIIADGMIGLIRAIDKFDTALGFCFITYAVWWIRHEIRRGNQAESRVIREPSTVCDDRVLVLETIKTLEHKVHRTPSIFEVSDASGLPVDRIEFALESDCVSFEGLTSEGTRLEEALEDESELVSERVEREESEAFARSMVDAIGDSRGKMVVDCYYGISSGSPITLEKIGAMLGVTRARVGQIKDRALRQIMHSKCIATH